MDTDMEEKMDDDLDLMIRETDGPMTCIWKVMYGKGWLTSAQILKLLEDSRFAEITLRNKFSRFPKTIMESRKISSEKKFGIMKEFRVIEGSHSPAYLEVTKIPSRVRAEDVQAKEERQQEGMTEALKHMNAMFAPRSKS